MTTEIEPAFLRICKGNIKEAARLQKVIHSMRKKTSDREEQLKSKRAIFINDNNGALLTAAKSNPLCKATTMSGKPCRCKAVNGDFCNRHSD